MRDPVTRIGKPHIRRQRLGDGLVGAQIIIREIHTSLGILDIGGVAHGVRHSATQIDEWLTIVGRGFLDARIRILELPASSCLSQRDYNA
jgi:hypothetical protein